MEPQIDDRVIQRDVHIINSLVAVAPGEIERDFPIEFGIQTCILASRIGMQVLKHYKVRCRAIPCDLTIYNAAFVERISVEGRMPKDDREAKKWSKQDGSWALGTSGTGRSNAQGRFDGHVVIMAYHNVEAGDTDGVLIDLALFQMSRPSRDINLQAVAASTPKGFMEGDMRSIAVVNRCFVYHRRLLDSTDWMRTNDWLDKERRHFIIERTIAKIDSSLLKAGFDAG